MPIRPATSSRTPAAGRMALEDEMHELVEYTDTAAAVWVVPGAWWVILRDEEETTILGDGELSLGPPPSCN